MSVPTILLSSGGQIPQLGFGVFQIEPADTEKAVLTAFEAGYRHVDTAQMYGNETEVGQAVTSSGLAREDVWITSKLNNGYHEPAVAKDAIAESLDRLGTPYLDLFLIHWPLPTLYGGDYVATWEVLIEAHQQGLLRNIGVSNFQIPHLRRITQDTGVAPAVNQIEVHPYFGNEEVRAHCQGAGIAVEAWSPIAQGAVLDDPTIGAVAKRVGKTPAQVVLRWHVQRGDIVFPKSTTPERVRENIAIFDTELSDEDMAMITGLDRGEAGRTGPNPDTFAYIPS